MDKRLLFVVVGTEKRDAGESIVYKLPAKLHRLPLVDVKLEVYVDKKQIGTGSFKKGISVSVPVSEGKHRVSVICWGDCYMDQAIVVEKNDSNLTLNLNYKVELKNGRYIFFIVSDR